MPILLYIVIVVVALFVGAVAYDLNQRRRRASGHDIESGTRRPGQTQRPVAYLAVTSFPLFLPRRTLCDLARLLKSDHHSSSASS